MSTTVGRSQPRVRYDRMGIAAIAVSVLAPLTRMHGRWQEPTTRCPAYFELCSMGLNLLFMPSFRSSSLGSIPYCILDICDASGKVMSVRWRPLEVVSFRRGEWLDRLDLLVRGVRPEVPEDWRVYTKPRTQRLPAC
jgi:hypothetical protein